MPLFSRESRNGLETPRSRLPDADQTPHVRVWPELGRYDVTGWRNPDLCIFETGGLQRNGVIG